MENTTRFTIISRLLFCAASVCLCICAVQMLKYSEHFLKGTTVNGVDVSRLTAAEAANRIRSAEEDYSLTVELRNGTKELNRSVLPARYDCEEELAGLLKEQDVLPGVFSTFGKKPAFTLHTDLSVDRAALRSILLSMPEISDPESPSDASVRMQDNRFRVVPEEEGSELDVDRLADAVESAIAKGDTSLDAEREGLYKEPFVRAADLSGQVDQLNRLISSEVVIDLGYRETVIDSRATLSWISIDEAGNYELSEENVKKQTEGLIRKIAEEDDCYGQYRAFASTNYGMQRFETDNYHGHVLDQEKMVTAVTDLLLSGKKGVVEAIYSEYADNADPRFGGDYVEVDIYNQHVYVYKDYELAFDCRCVTGTEGVSGTPSGIFEIEEMERGRMLNGYRSDGSLRYSVYVDYWMSFLPRYGLHDASWRDEFGGDIYEYDGSHGCVNLSYSSAKTIYSLIDYGTPVIILRGDPENAA